MKIPWRRTGADDPDSGDSDFSLQKAIPLISGIEHIEGISSETGQARVQITNHSGQYDLTLTHDTDADSLYLGVELYPAAPVTRDFAIELLQENQRLNHAKIAIEQNEGQDTYRILALGEVRTPDLSGDRLIDEIQSFDAAVTYEFGQIRQLADKAGVVLPELQARQNKVELAPIERDEGILDPLAKYRQKPL